MNYNTSLRFFLCKKLSEFHLSSLYYHAKMVLSTFWKGMQGDLCRILMAFLLNFSIKS